MTFCIRRFFKASCQNGFKPFQLQTISDDAKIGDKFSTQKDNEIKSVKQLLEDDLVSSFEQTISVDPEKRSVLLFPGQGSQYVGMIDSLIDYPNVSDMFNVASEILNFDLLKYCQSGPKEELDRTVHCQPAVMVTSLAGVEKIQVCIFVNYKTCPF